MPERLFVYDFMPLHALTSLQKMVYNKEKNSEVRYYGLFRI